ncbi:bifunctional (p)ppGpp synthetase/guanosine-3',5'-bis(diphosphate) 3'-pyrophosphohydrolase [Candidatus Peregrinibacteria bacterium]|nr:bifunctional (p)ppGpp synthetase/guanosine-3',5'-bis(diphosphate) 3'-pyrophosphohydrolase [Candidatus Peregrinibacteria bacterium]
MPSLLKIISKAQSYLPHLNSDRVREAYLFALEAHKGQKRKGGDPYFIHPFETTQNLLRLRVDEDTIIAALLHDVPEDTAFSISDIEKKFGKEVAFLVDGITKLSKVHYQENMKERQIESLKKLFLHSAQDIRIILIKLADRLHNMRTLHYVRPEKRVRIAEETMEIFVPVANLLGIWEIKAELEDLCFQYLHPDAYKALSSQIQAIKKKQKHVVTEMVNMVKTVFDEHNMKAEVSGRPKNLHSIFLKIERSKKKLIEINDLIALRIIVEHSHECYEALGIVHSLFKPKAGRVKDFISVPKPNGYQSLHTTVFGLDGIATEFQIRTKSMHLEAEYGIAAHYFYKKRPNPSEDHLLEKNQPLWIQKILDLQKHDKDDDEFIQNLKLDVFQDRIFVFTPKGDVIDLPKGATALDFAYAVHTDIGHSATKAEINRQTASLRTRLKTGDTVSIVTHPHKKSPSRESLNYVVTHLAKNRIKEFFRHQTKIEKMRLGRMLLKKTIEHGGRIFDLDIQPKRIQPVLEKFRMGSVDDLFMAIGVGNIDPKNVFQVLYDEKMMRSLSGTVFERKTITQNLVHYRARLKIESRDYMGHLANIAKAVSSLNVNIIKIKSSTDWHNSLAVTIVDIEVIDFDELSRVFEALEEIEGVFQVKRIPSRRWGWFVFLSAAVFMFWAMHPFFIHYLSNNSLASNLALYFGLGILFVPLFFLYHATERTFPELKNTYPFWITSFSLNFLVFLTIFFEIEYYRLSLNWFIALMIVVLIHAYLIVKYFFFRKKSKKWDEKQRKSVDNPVTHYIEST